MKKRRNTTKTLTNKLNNRTRKLSSQNVFWKRNREKWEEFLKNKSNRKSKIGFLINRFKKQKKI